jgi:hypothetical protein
MAKFAQNEQNKNGGKFCPFLRGATKASYYPLRFL